jgi:hypothetical protein
MRIRKLLEHKIWGARKNAVYNNCSNEKEENKGID